MRSDFHVDGPTGTHFGSKCGWLCSEAVNVCVSRVKVIYESRLPPGPPVTKHKLNASSPPSLSPGARDGTACCASCAAVAAPPHYRHRAAPRRRGEAVPRLPGRDAIEGLFGLPQGVRRRADVLLPLCAHREPAQSVGGPARLVAARRAGLVGLRLWLPRRARALRAQCGLARQRDGAHSAAQLQVVGHDF